MGREWRAVTSVGDPLPGVAGRPTGDGSMFVASWRTPGEELELDVDSDDLRAALRHPGAPLEVREVAGFLGVPYVSSVHFVAP